MLATILLPLALAAAEPGIGPPADPKVEVALELIEAVHMDRMFDQLEPQLAKMMQQQVAQIVPCDAAKPVSEAIGKDFAKMFDEMMDIERMKVDIAAIYAETFSESEMRQILEFYHSPAGEKMIEKMPELMQKSMQISQDQVQTMQPKMMAMMQSHDAELRAASQACAAEKSDEKPGE